MAAVVTGPDAKPAASHCCRFELKKYKTAFTCQVCRVESYDAERYRCNHCGEDRHMGCIRLADEIKLGPGPKNIFSTGPVFMLFDTPQKGRNSKNEKWAKNCLVCGMPIRHYSYHAQTTGNKDLNMHPRCAELTTFNTNSRVPLELQTGERHSCVWCGKKRPEGASPAGPTDFYCWSYRLTGGRNRIHVHCYTEMVIEALKSIAQLDDDDNIHIVLKRRRSSDRNELESILSEVLKIGQDVAGIGFTDIFLDLA
ncbi:hypothetical protein CRG98_032904 [Punica granatum]|uniref:Phorbol-ester/DAG-type domain-containing protein n=1 Tax=Punica granatum TaxID=22663 RepID=A0A2I0IRD9_PUNGR|nr:hypothetical protein CRG98_032904 [Punica granatum]